jgi:hypothetical protein
MELEGGHGETQSGHAELHRTCPLLGVKRTSTRALQMSAFDPKRTLWWPLVQSQMGCLQP